MTLGEYLVKLLAAYGVDTVFGIPGVHTVEMYRGLAGSGIRHVTPRHEQGAGFMADGYARVTGKPGVALVITGPGLTNIVTAMGQAYADSIPMLVISAVNPRGNCGHGEGELHESPDQSRLAAQVAASSFGVQVPRDLPKAVARAFALFEAARPRPVHIQIPVDLFSASADGLSLDRAVPLHPPRPAKAAIGAAATLCDAAQAPVMFLGGGADGPSALRLAERLGAPVVMTTNARAMVPHGHPLGVPASPSLQAVRALADRADLVLAIGTELGRTDYNMYDRAAFASPAPLIRVDIDPLQMVRNHGCAVALTGDAGAGAADLLDALNRIDPAPDAHDRARAARQAARRELPRAYAPLYDLLATLRDLVPNATVVGDSTQASYAGNLYHPVGQGGRWFNAATGFGALGYGLPAAIGARVGAPDRPTVCLVGDGGLQFSLAELGTVIEANTGPFVLICLNNQGYGEIKSAMQARGVAPVGVDLHTPDFAGIARAYGFRAVTLERLADFVNHMSDALGSTQPTLIEIDAAILSPDP